MKKQIQEKIKPSQQYTHSLNNALYTIEEVIDTENLTKWLQQELNKLTNLHWNLKEKAQYLGTDNDNERVQNELITDEVLSKDIMSKYNGESLTVLCRDGKIIISPENFSSIYEPTTWLYNDLTKQDAKQIAEYLADVINSKRSKQADNVDNMLFKKRYSKDKLSEHSKLVAGHVADLLEELKTKLPRGKSRTSISVRENKDLNVSTIYVTYKPSAYDKPELICSFDVIEITPDSVDVSALSADGKTELESVTHNESDNGWNNVDALVEENLLDEFGKWYESKK